MMNKTSHQNYVAIAKALVIMYGAQNETYIEDEKLKRNEVV